jgi:hypothetical protein
MSLRKKLVIGLGFLFLIIFSLVIYSSFQIQALSKDAKAIIKDNYASLVYCKSMLISLDDMRTAVTSQLVDNRATLSKTDEQLFANGKATFEANFAKEKGNITEIHEADYIGELSRAYELFLALSSPTNHGKGDSSALRGEVLSAYTQARLAISRIDDLNMEAIQRKNDVATVDANRMTTSIAAAGAICIILAFLYFWYFPFYVSNSLSYLADRMKGLLSQMGIKPDTQTQDEAFVLLHSIGLIENRLVHENSKKRRT